MLSSALQPKTQPVLESPRAPKYHHAWIIQNAFLMRCLHHQASIPIFSRYQVDLVGIVVRVRLWSTWVNPDSRAQFLARPIKALEARHVRWFGCGTHEQRHARHAQFFHSASGLPHHDLTRQNARTDVVKVTTEKSA